MLPHVQQINIFDSEKEVEYHSHSICEIIYLLRGQCDITIRGQPFCMTAGDVMVIAPGEVHNQICNGRVKNYFIIFSAGEAEFSCHTRLLHCGLNPLFLRFFRMLLLLPMEYLQDLRMSQARQLLLIPYYSIAEVANRCGYSNANYFSRLFRKIHHCSPSGYKDIVKSRKDTSIRL